MDGGTDAGTEDTPQTLKEDIRVYKGLCPTCQRHLPGKAEDYPICTLAEHFRTVKDKLEQAAKKKGIMGGNQKL